MNILRILLSFVLVLTLFTSCKEEHNPEVKTLPVTETVAKKKVLNPDATYAKAEFNIEGMSCAVGCAAKIEKSFVNMDGIKSAKVDFENEIAQVEYDIDLVNPDKLTERVKKAGDYSVENMKTVDAFSSLK